MRRAVIGFGILAVLLLWIFVAHKLDIDFDHLMPPQWKDFEELDVVDRSVLNQFPVNGEYLQWVGTGYVGPGNPDTIIYKLEFDKPNRFAIKAITNDTTGFFTKMAGDIAYSGRWTEANDKLTLKFYFPPESWNDLFDSLQNRNAVRFINEETIEIDKRARTIWVMETKCDKLK